jgi:aryl-alcohol dehydrogenase-like predicted oxidoreductase
LPPLRRGTERLPFVKRKESNLASRLVLGTAQLGMPYGVANNTGQPDFETAMSIIKTAWEYGIREFDTAPVYGESEAVLGRSLSSLGISHEAKIITKLDPKLEPHQGQSLKMALDKSLERLQISSLYGLLVHREEWLDDLNNGLGNILQEFVRLGLVQHLGVSLYSPAKALQAMESDILEVIQVPANILDRRFADAGVFNVAEEKGKQVYIRSVFLQGLLLMRSEDLPANMAFVKPTLGKIDNLCLQYNYTRQKIALLYIKGKYPQAKIIFGADTTAQLEQNLNIWEDNFTSISEINEFDNLSIIDERIINPSFWP